MITLKKTAENKLIIQKNGNNECKPWGLETFENKVIIKSLVDRESTYEGLFSDFVPSTGGTFDTLESFITYITPCLGFKTAPGGSGVSYNSASIIRTGQVISHYPFDDGAIQAGREVSFLELLNNNPFGNKNRFTDILGTSVYDDPIAIDWSTFDGESVLAYYLEFDSIVDNYWSNIIEYCKLMVVSGYSGWRMPNVRELLNICQYVDYGYPAFGYAPFNNVSADAFWTSTNSTDQAMFISNVGGTLSNALKIATAKTVPVRLFTLNELI